jgi:CDGSH-type Zn-finger protein
MSEPLTITCRENGPLVVKLPVRVVDHLGNEYAVPTGKETIALCRCGQSANKPFCDGKHKQVNFQGGALAPPKSS